MALSETEIVFIVVACCGAVLLTIFIIIFIVCCVMERKRSKRVVRREPSFKSGQGRAKFLDYERRVFRPPASTGSSSYKNRIDNRSVSSSSVNNTPNRKRKLPPPGYDINYDARSFGFNPHFENDIQYNRRSIVITDNTVYIPFAPRYNDNFLPDRHESNYRLPRLSIREIDDEVSINDDRQFPPNYQSSAEDDRNYSSSYSPRADNRRNFRSNYRHKGYPRYDLDYM